MPYDEAFFAQYAAYLQEPTVRSAHDWVFEIAKMDVAFERVIDLGCGSCEFLRYADPLLYIGIDHEPRPPELNRTYWLDRPGARIGKGLTDSIKREELYLKDDYRAYFAGDGPTEIAETLATIGYRPTAFVSLFSSEITDQWTKNYDLYHRLFEAIPSLQAGLVSGFYYSSKWGKAVVDEEGDVWSWQTNEPQFAAYSSVFSERRISMPVPSQMFSPHVNDVYEVWKFFQRREK